MPETDAFNEGMISLSFDDGLKNHFEVVHPVLAKHGLRAVFYVATGRLGKRFPDKMTKENLLELQEYGHEIGAHTRSHIDLRNRYLWTLNREVNGSKNDLKKMGIAAATFAYPFGKFDDRSRQWVINSGFSGARCNQQALNTPSSDRYALKTLNIVWKTTLDDVQQKIAEALSTKSWLILQFHVVEVSDYKWAVRNELFEKICEAVAASKIKVVTVREGVEMMK